MTARVLIFAKAPLMGLSKTRLAKGLGKAEAQRLARMSFARTVRAAMDPRWQTRLYAAPDKMLGDGLGGLWPQSLIRCSQGHGSLGDRLARGYREAPPHSSLIFIGADAPDVTKALLWRAIGGLRTHDGVVGPASDGGFWLLGLRRTHRTDHPFAGVRWSSAHTLSDVLENLGESARIARLPTMIDLDEAEDWQAWAASQRR
ncbi:MAG: DUF2064 domain-containing protein [Pseudomonadota bacterium]